MSIIQDFQGNRASTQHDLLREATDEDLLAQVHVGNDAAFAELYDRHRLDAHRYARRLTHRYLHRNSAEDVVSEAVRKVLAAVRRGGGPTKGFREYLFTAVRSVTFTERLGVSVEASEPPFDSTLPSADENLDTFVAMSAFDSLPERWQQVLWATEVTELTPTEMAPLVGLRANTIAALAVRAREALRIAYVRAHLPPVQIQPCHDALELIARRAATTLKPAQSNRLTRHLALCEDCRRAEMNIHDEIATWSRATPHGLVPKAFRPNGQLPLPSAPGHVA